MKKEDLIKLIKIIITCIILFLFVWLLFIYPLGTFSKNEHNMMDAAKKYYANNSNFLPKEGAVSTVAISKLYDQRYLDALYVPYTKNLCSTDESWVKVKRENGEYKYYAYLKCGVLSSNVDHTGPNISLNGDETIKMDIDEEYKELGVKTVTDDSDGKIATKNVIINNSNVDTSKVGTYTVTYKIRDSFNNETIKERTIIVTKSLSSTVKKATDDSNYYKGASPANYIKIAGIMFRIVNLNSDGSVKIVTNEDAANVNFDGLKDWNNEYFYSLLPNESKKSIKKNSLWCNSKDGKTDSLKCDGTNTKSIVGMLNSSDYNNSVDENKQSYLYVNTYTWTADEATDNTAIVTSSVFSTKYAKLDKKFNLGVKPALNINKGVYLVSGNGTEDSPYEIGDIKIGRKGDNISKRYVGEYFTYSGYLWRIIKVNEDKTVKSIMIDTLKDANGIALKVDYDNVGEPAIYNPNKKGNIAYKIEHQLSSYLDASYLDSKKIEVPIYKESVLYNKQKSVKKYNSKVAIPNMYDAFSIGKNGEDFWLINSSEDSNIKSIISNMGVVYFDGIYENTNAGAKIVANFSKNVVIKDGYGTAQEPYQLTK